MWVEPFPDQHSSNFISTSFLSNYMIGCYDDTTITFILIDYLDRDFVVISSVVTCVQKYCFAGRGVWRICCVDWLLDTQHIEIPAIKDGGPRQ